MGRGGVRWGEAEIRAHGQSADGVQPWPSGRQRKHLDTWAWTHGHIANELPAAPDSDLVSSHPGMTGRTRAQTALRSEQPRQPPTRMRASDAPTECSTCAAHTYSATQPASMNTMKRSESDTNARSCLRGYRMELRGWGCGGEGPWVEDRAGSTCQRRLLQVYKTPRPPISAPLTRPTLPGPSPAQTHPDHQPPPTAAAGPWPSRSACAPPWRPHAAHGPRHAPARMSGQQLA